MANQQLTSASKIHLDARKFLGTINKKGFAGQIRLVEDKLKKLSEETNSNLGLVSHFGDSIYFKDANTDIYYQADVKKNNRTLHLENINVIVIEDNEKAKIFDDACNQLVDSIEESIDSGDMTKAESVFNKIAIGYCTPRVIPECGRVRTWDGQIHKININRSVIPEEVRPEVVKALKEAVKSSSVVIKEGTITIGEDKVELPINEATRRLVVARNMRAVAENAYTSDNFNRLMKTVAGHVSNNNMRDAVSILKSFLTEEQEFTMLDKDGVYTLVEDTLYRQGIINYHTARNTALLFWETNCHLNKKDIVKEWSIAASSCKNNQLRNNVEILKESSKASPIKFSDTFDKFLKNVFTEDHSSRTVKARSYLNMLKMLNNVVVGSDADKAVKGSVDDLVMRLESDLNSVDDATLFEVEDLLATVSADLIHDTSTLADFDTIPEPFKVDIFGSDEDMVGDFEGDMGGGDDLGGGIGDLSGDVGDTEIDDVTDENAEENTEEEEDLDIQLDSIISKAKPINEMVADDIKTVLEALKKIKPEVVEIDGEFRKMLKSGLTESQISFIRKVMNHSKQLDEALFEGMASVYYDLVIREGSSPDNSDHYEFDGNGDIEINEDYKGIEEKKDPAPNEGGKDEAGKKGAEERGNEAAGADDGVTEDVVSEDGLDIEGHNKDSEENDDKDGDHDDNNPVDESIAIVSADNDEKLLSLIDQVLGGSNDDTEGEEEDDGDDAEDAEGEEDGDMIVDQDVDDPNAPPALDDAPDNDAPDGVPWQEGAVKEDNNITDPDASAAYDSEKTADKDGHGKTINPKPKFSDKDYDGTAGAKTGKDKPGTGHPNTSK